MQPAFLRGRNQESDGNRLVLGVVGIYCIIFLTGFTIGVKFPPEATSDQPKQFARLLFHRRLLRDCMLSLADVQNNKEFVDRDGVGSAPTLLSRADLRSAIQECHTDLGNFKVGLQNCHRRLGQYDYEVEEADALQLIHNGEGEMTANDETALQNARSIIKVALKSTTDAGLKQVAEELQSGERVSRTRIVDFLVRQVNQTRTSLKAVQKECNDFGDHKSEVKQMLAKMNYTSVIDNTLGRWGS
eukprot:TRINITY_DN3578_c0_g1_i1.p1 TRINITY_DN3578_c0_g1~~TRINITY_DN3578_c0_g1_i1.p1  ORF type:complete len:244 (+),score=46.92 TRINITY_DN3578_c0_g1_i1:187-918(+)